MDSFGLDASLKRREAEQARRREALLKQMRERNSQATEAEQRTSAIVSESQALKREKELRAEFERIQDEGAPDNGVKLEVFLVASVHASLRPDSDRVRLPAELLTDLSGRPNVAFPMLFEVFNPANKKRTHCGVLEFSAEPGTVELPQKVARCIGLWESSGQVRVRYKTLAKCTSVVLQVPASMYATFPDFRAFLESSLRTQYATLSTGDELLVGNDVPIVVGRTEPDPAVCIIDADVELDLAVIGEEDGDKWLVGSETTVQGQRRLYLPRQLRGGELLRLTRQTSGDVLVSFPPSVDADFDSFDSIADSQIDLNAHEFLSHQSPEFVTVGVGPGQSAAVKAEIVSVNSGEASSSNSQQCDVCLRSIPVQSFELHRVRCRRLFRLCSECRRPFPQKEPHVHCAECGMAYADVITHRERWHSQIACLCGAKVTRGTLQTHRERECPNRLLKCRFCQLWVPRGSVEQMDARDRFMGFQSEHEAACGNRTEVCPVCHRRERLKDMDFHREAYHSFA